jgi:hypothetical protein
MKQTTPTPHRYSYFQHPNQVGMSYCEHWKLSMYFARKLFFASIKAIIHAFIPSTYKTSTSDLTKHLHKVLYE